MINPRSRSSELAHVRRQLSQNRQLIQNPDLKERVREWIQESHEQTDADSAREFLESRLTELLAEDPMYWSPELDHGADGFPDECEGCRHYGSACPVLRDQTEIRWRERLLEEAETDDEAREVYKQQAIDVGCHRIPEFLEEWDSDHAAFVQRGRELFEAVEEDLASDGLDLDEDVEEIIESGVGGVPGG